jgi:YHYH protein
MRYQTRRTLYGCFLCLILFSFGLKDAAAQGHDGSDLTALPLGDGRLSSAPQVGYIWVCNTGTGPGGGAFALGPWINTQAGTFDITTKASVDGEVTWSSTFAIAVQGETRVVTGNGLPTHPTGTFPIARTDDAFAYDRNPNRIQAQALMYALPLMPTLAAQPSCLNGGVIGVLLTGSVLFNGLDALNRDAVAHETQDACMGHPQREGQYHYHNLTPCLADSQHGVAHSPLMGYALDGFGIYGHHGENGEALTSAALDACHGHTHAIEWNGQTVEMYHYHATNDYPYTLGCYRGTPAVVQRQGAPGAGPRPPRR